MAVKLLPGDAGCWFQLGQVRERQKDWSGAREAYTVAMELQPGVASYHARLGRVAKSRKSWAEAVAHYRRALNLEPDQAVWAHALASNLIRSDDIRATIDILDLDVLEKALADSDDRVPLLKVIADAAEIFGQWDRASSALLEILEATPEDHAMRYRLAHCLERHHSVLLTFDADGRATVSRAAEDAFTRASMQLAYLIEHDPRRVHAAYRLGALNENHGDPTAAARAYRTALARIEEIDASWTHATVHDWRFRLAYVTPAEDRSDPRLERRATPAGSPHAAAPGGFFETIITARGLRLSGFLAPGTEGSVAIHAGSHLLKRISVDTKPWLPAFAYEISHDVLAQFDERTNLTLTVGNQPLVTADGATVVQVDVPGGTGQLGEWLVDGRKPTKWGGWPATAAEQAERLRIYTRTKVVMEEQFGKRLFLFYGTLLGQHRDDGFIPGDDDLDCAYVADSTQPKDLKSELQETSLRLLEGGLDVSFAVNGRMIKTGLNGIWIDVIPVWFHRGRAWSFDAHNLGREAFEPALATTFQGQDVYVPSDPEAFLVDNYGPDWRIPRSDFRYYQDKDDRKVLAKTWLTPSEVREFTLRAEEVRRHNPSAGTFAGLEIPGAEPGFR